ncbi:MAG TPA: TfoX/Sxy family protein [Anaeromyxobacteraceae bacterium]
MAMRFEKPSPRMVTLFDGLIEGRPLQRRPMFGMPCAFAGGQMCVGLFADSLFLRLSEADREVFAAAGGRPFEPFPGRTMREYMVFPPAMLGDRRALRAWLDRSQGYAGSLPPKAGKKKTARAVQRKGAAKPARRKAPAA